MRHKKRGVGILRTWLYGHIICLPLLLLTWSQAQAQTSEQAVTERDLNDCKAAYSYLYYHDILCCICSAVIKVNVVSSTYSLSFSVDDEDKERYSIENITCRTTSGPQIVATKEHVW